MEKWEVQWAVYSSEQMSSLLAEGWEPFSVTVETFKPAAPAFRVWFRKYLKGEEMEDR